MRRAGTTVALSNAGIAHRIKTLGIHGEFGQSAYVAEQLGLMARARRQVLGRWRGRYLLGVRFLVAAGQGSELIPELARSPRPYVRARAAEWSVDYPTPAVIVALLGLLDDPDPMCAFCAKDALSRMGRVAVTPLNGYLRTASGTRALAGLQVAAGLHDGDLASAATRFATDEQWAVRAAAAEVLGASADDDSVAALLRLLDDDHPAVRAAAVGALGGLQHWPASRDLVRLTTDDDWSVRVAAGRSLVDLGAAGQLLLEHVARQGGQAGDMASRLLSASLL